MKENTAMPELEALLRGYQVAVVAFNAATAGMIHHLAASTLPSDQEISAEEDARAAVVAARRGVWDIYRKGAEGEIENPSEACSVTSATSRTSTAAAATPPKVLRTTTGNT